MDVSAILETSRTNLQFTIPHWKSMLMINSLQKNDTLKIKYALLINFLVTLQLFHKKIPSQWCLTFFIFQLQPTLFRRPVGVHHKKQIYEKIIHSLFHEPPSEKSKTPKTNKSTFLPHRTLEYWIFLNRDTVTSKTNSWMFWTNNLNTFQKHSH